tara:strand:- start:945 stop:1211 length:267 start_codon:yes stop_codon:yes gene_type:complete
MTNEETSIYKVWVDRKPNVPTLRIEWKQTEDLLPKFIKSLEEWQQRKLYEHMRNHMMAMGATGGNHIHNYYAEYNNKEGIEYLKGLIS